MKMNQAIGASVEMEFAPLCWNEAFGAVFPCLLTSMIVLETPQTKETMDGYELLATAKLIIARLGL